MIIQFEMNGINDTRPFLLTWQVGEGKYYDIEIPKNIHRADLLAGWNVTGEDHNYHIHLQPCFVDLSKVREEDNGEHRFWTVRIMDVFGDEPKQIGKGTVSWGEFYVMDGLTEDDMTEAETNV